MQCYVNKDTCSQGKIMATAYCEGLVRANNVFSITRQSNPISVINPNKKAIYLVGAPAGLERHIQDKRRDPFGFRKDKDHIVVEINKKTHAGLVKKAAELNFKGKIIHGDMLDIIRRTNNISHIDYDGVNVFGKNEIEAIDLCIKKKVDTGLIIVSTRNFTKELLLLAKRIRSRKSSKNNKLVYTHKNIINKYLQDTLKGKNYHYHLYPYRGMNTPMMQILLIKA